MAIADPLLLNYYIVARWSLWPSTHLQRLPIPWYLENTMLWVDGYQDGP